MLFAGNSNPGLTKAIAAHLQIPMGKAIVDRFSDGEVMVEIAENVSAREIFVIQSVCSPTNDNLIELLVLIDALRRAFRSDHHGGDSVSRLRSSRPAAAFGTRTDHGQSGGKHDF